MHADFFLTIGHGHKICQDYSWAGDVSQSAEPLMAAMVSDGCSSSPHTDSGSRLLIHEARSMAQYRAPYVLEGRDFRTIAAQARLVAERLRLPSTATDATLLLAFPTTDKRHIQVLMAGDGVIAARRRNSTNFRFRNIEFSDNAPGYPIYLADPGRMAMFQDPNGAMGVRQVTLGFNDEEPLKLTQQADPESFWYEELFSVDEYDLIVLMSDGATSFRRNTEIIPVSRIVQETLAIKTSAGEFLQRRLNRMMKDFHAQGIQPYDDFSAAAIYLG